MCSYKRVLLASHGTEGARAAERLAVSICTESLHHLIVTPDFWAGMMGDDWLNNAAVREEYGTYVERQLAAETDAHIARVAEQAQGLRYTYEVALGRPDHLLLESVRRSGCDVVVIGSPRPRSVPGLRSHMLTSRLTRALAIPLLMTPYPSVH